MVLLEEYLKYNPKKVLIFDFDQTLIQLNLPWEIWESQITKLIESYGMHIKPSLTMVDNINRVTRKVGIEFKKQVEDITRGFEKEHLEGYETNMELIRFIKEHHNEYEIYLWTLNMRETVEPLLTKYEVFKYFKDIIDRGKTLLSKPEIDGFKLIKNSNYELIDYLFIGDSTFDRRAAIKSHIDFFYVGYFKD